MLIIPSKKLILKIFGGFLLTFFIVLIFFKYNDGLKTQTHCDNHKNEHQICQEMFENQTFANFFIFNLPELNSWSTLPFFLTLFIAIVFVIASKKNNTIPCFLEELFSSGILNPKKP